jgi:hypothetical protein
MIPEQEGKKYAGKEKGSKEEEIVLGSPFPRPASSKRALFSSKLPNPSYSRR